MQNETNQMDYQKLVETSRELARHALRTRNIRSQVEEIASINQTKENNIKNAKTKLQSAELNLKNAQYVLAKKQLDKNLGDPYFEETIKELTKNLENNQGDYDKEKEIHDNVVAEKSETMKNLNAQIVECNEKIGRWVSGENKVQLENINKLAGEYIEKALNEKARKLLA